MDTAALLRRAVVYRHTAAGLAFWGEVARAIAHLPNAHATLQSLVDLAGESENLQAWLTEAGLEPKEIASVIEPALRALQAPSRTKEGGRAARRAASVVRGVTRAGIWSLSAATLVMG